MLSYVLLIALFVASYGQDVPSSTESAADLTSEDFAVDIESANEATISATESAADLTSEDDAVDSESGNEATISATESDSESATDLSSDEDSADSATPSATGSVEDDASGDDDDDDDTDDCIDEDYLSIEAVADTCSVCVCGDSDTQECSSAIEAIAAARDSVNQGLANKITTKCNLDCGITFVGLTDDALDAIADGSTESCSCDVLECKDEEVSIVGSTNSVSIVSIAMAMAAVSMAILWI